MSGSILVGVVCSSIVAAIFAGFCVASLFWDVGTPPAWFAYGFAALANFSFALLMLRMPRHALP